MADPANDFLKDYQAMAQQSWDAWTRYLQQPGATAPFGAGASPFGSMGTARPRVRRTPAGPPR